MQLFINTEAEATNSLVTGIDNNSTQSLPVVYIGDNLDVSVTFSDGAGDLWEYTGRSSISVLVGIGTIEDRTAMTTQTLTHNQGSYEGALSINTTALNNYLGEENSKDLFLEVQVSFVSGNTETLLQKSITLRRDLIR